MEARNSHHVVHFGLTLLLTVTIVWAFLWAMERMNGLSNKLDVLNSAMETQLRVNTELSERLVRTEIILDQIRGEDLLDIQP